MSKVLQRQLQPTNASARRSQRRINKLLQKNISSYQIPNPYRSFKSHQCLPHGLGRQLGKMDVLSVRSLQNLHFHQPTVYEEVNQLLLKMREAVERQSQEFGSYICEMTQKMKKYSQKTLCEQTEKQQPDQEVEQLDNSAFMPKDSEASIQLQLEEQDEGDLPLVSRQSDGASMMSDNYESDRLVFHSDHNMHHHHYENDEMEEPYLN